MALLSTAFNTAVFPPEIWGVIFEHACQRQGGSSALTLSWVCFEWRSIVLIHPKLWAYINITESTTLCSTQLYIKRSVQIPLSISISILSNTNANWIPVLITELLREASRWKEVHVDVHAWITVFPSRTIMRPHAFPLLQSLTLGWRQHRVMIQDDFWQLPHAVPALRTVRLGGWHRYQALALPWGQIRDLKFTDGYVLVDYPASVDPLGIVNRSPHRFPATIVLRDLLELHVRRQFCITTLVVDLGCWECELRSVRNFLWVPTLRDLTIHVKACLRCEGCQLGTTGEPAPKAEDYTSLVAGFIDASRCALQSLSIIVEERDLHFRHVSICEGLEWVFQVCRGLKAFSIVDCGPGPGSVTSHFVETLLRIHGSSDGMRDLEEVEIVWAEKATRSHGIAAVLAHWLPMRAGRMAEMNGLKELRKVVLGARRGASVDTRVTDLLQELRMEGVQATLW